MRRLLALVLALFAAPALGQDASWPQAAMPYVDSLNASVASQMGGGEAVFVRDGWASLPCASYPANGAVMIRTWRRSAADRKMAKAAVAAQKLKTTAPDLDALDKATFNGCYISSPTPDFGPGKRASGWMGVGSEPFGWGGKWWFCAPPNRALLCEADEEYYKGFLHFYFHGMDKGVWITLGCKVAAPKGAFFTETDWSDPTQVVWRLNGKEQCRATIPEQLRQSMFTIYSLTAGGVAPPPSAKDYATYMSFVAQKIEQP